MGDLSAHFSRSEFRCHDGSRLPRGVPSMRLVAALERLRTGIGDRPIRIISGYRTRSYNRAVGGAKDSRHMHGDAADIPSALHVSVERAWAAGFTGVGYDRDGDVVHVDVRPGPRVSFPDY